MFRFDMSDCYRRGNVRTVDAGDLDAAQARQGFIQQYLRRPDLRFGHLDGTQYMALKTIHELRGLNLGSHLIGMLNAECSGGHRCW